MKKQALILFIVILVLVAVMIALGYLQNDQAFIYQLY